MGLAQARPNYNKYSGVLLLQYRYSVCSYMAMKQLFIVYDTIIIGITVKEVP